MARSGSSRRHPIAHPVRSVTLKLPNPADRHSCQCGVSRSATLAIAYIMSLAASGLVPNLLGHLGNMQDAYEYIKSRSPCIGPNVSYVSHPSIPYPLRSCSVP